MGSWGGGCATGMGALGGESPMCAALRMTSERVGKDFKPGHSPCPGPRSWDQTGRAAGESLSADRAPEHVGAALALQLLSSGHLGGPGTRTLR